MNNDTKKGIVGLCLAYQGQNYGMLLQAYATQTIIEMQGYKTEIISYQRTSNKHIRFTPYLLIFCGKQIWNKYKRKKNEQIVLDEKHQMNISERKKVASIFREKRLHNIIECKGIENLEKLAKKYNTVLVGSDQQWLPDIAFSNFRTLRFVPESINKVSYATSLGVSQYPHYCKSSAAQFLKRINYISVRETEGKRIINELCDKPVSVVLDPTYLLTQEQWCELIKPERLIKEEYVLCYLLGDNEIARKLARKYANERNMKLITIVSDESVSGEDFSFADQAIVGKSPEEFINLIRFSSQIFTDSFHGIAFSIITQKQFFAFYRQRKGEKSRNSRIDNILKQWEINYRLIDNYNSEIKNIPDINYKEVNKKLNARRCESMDFLVGALEDRNNGNN